MNHSYLKTLCLLLLISAFSRSGIAQNTSGKITYDSRMFWVNIYTKLPWMSKEDVEKEMAIWGKNQGKWSTHYTLEFDVEKTFYTEDTETENRGYSWRGDNLFIYKDLKNKEMISRQPLADKDFIISDATPRIKWKILNEVREIQGYLCMKAVTTHPVYGTDVTAWYTDQIPVGAGPDGFGGLPGMILMLVYNEDDLIIEASSITLNSGPVTQSLPKKLKGKAVTAEEFYQTKKKFYDEAMQRKENPFWAMRY